MIKKDFVCNDNQENKAVEVFFTGVYPKGKVFNGNKLLPINN
ncbi:MAG: hypothetical protein OXC92_07035 [Flavobacteriaceae bacterium]|nr:hypothetical protein [Flavobacteriaceae bacterium]